MLQLKIAEGMRLLHGIVTDLKKSFVKALKTQKKAKSLTLVPANNSNNKVASKLFPPSGMNDLSEFTPSPSLPPSIPVFPCAYLPT